MNRFWILPLLAVVCQAAAVRNRLDVGGVKANGIAGIAIDSGGFIYIAGTTSWTDFPTTPGPLSHFSGGDGTSALQGDVFVRKLEPGTFRVIYSVLVGGSGAEICTGIVVDSSGNAYVTGSTKSSNFPAIPGPSTRSASRQDTDAFLFKLNATGTALIFSKSIGGSGDETPNGIALGKDGSISIAGSTDSQDLPVTPNAVQPYLLPGSTANMDAFAMRISGDGAVLQYSTYLGGPGGDSATDIAVDAAGNMYIAGIASAFFPTLANSFSPSQVAGGFVSKISAATGQLLYSTYIPGVEAGQLTVRVDAQGQAYVAGLSGSPGFPATPGAFQSDPAGSLGADAFVLELDAQGQNLIFATLIGSPGDDEALALTLQGDAVIISGITSLTNFPTTDHSLPACDLSAAPGYYFSDAFQPSGTFVTSFDHSGKLLKSVVYSDCNNERPTALVAGTSSVYLAATYSTSQWTYLAELDLGASAAVVIDHVVDSASYQTGPFAPLEIITILGKGFGSKAGVGVATSGNSLPTSLGGTKVFFNGSPLPLLYVSDHVIEAILPASIQPIYHFPIVVSTPSGSSSTLGTYLLFAAPGIFTADGSGVGQGVIVNENGTINSASNAAPRGSIISVYGTGGGVTTPSFPDGSIVPGAANLTFTGYMTVGLRLGEILYQGAVPTLVSGMTVVNLRIPLNVSPGPSVPVRWGVFYGGGTVFSQPGVTVAIK